MPLMCFTSPLGGGADSLWLMQAVAMVSGSAPPGEEGNVQHPALHQQAVLMAHRLAESQAREAALQRQIASLQQRGGAPGGIDVAGSGGSSGEAAAPISIVGGGERLALTGGAKGGPQPAVKQRCIRWIGSRRLNAATQPRGCGRVQRRFRAAGTEHKDAAAQGSTPGGKDPAVLTSAARQAAQREMPDSASLLRPRSCCHGAGEVVRPSGESWPAPRPEAAVPLYVARTNRLRPLRIASTACRGR